MRGDFGYFEEKKLGKPYDLKLLKRLYPYTRPYRSMLFWSIGLVLLITGLDLALPYVTKVAIDRYIVPQVETQTSDSRIYRVDISQADMLAVINKYSALFTIEDRTAWIPFDSLTLLEKSDLAILRQNDMSGLGGLAIVFLILIVINFGLNFAQKMVMEYTGFKIMHDLRMQLFRHIQNLSVKFFTRNPVGRLVTRTTSDVQNMHELFTSLITFVFKDVIMLLGIATVMLLLNWRLALVTFIVLPVVIYASIVFAGKARKIFRVLRIKVAEINTRFLETIEGMRVVQLFRQEANNYRRFKQLNHENYLAGLRQIHIMAVFMPIIEVLGISAIAIIIFYGGSRTLEGSLSLGGLVAFISYIRMFFRPIRDLAEKYNILQNAMASAERIFQIFDTRDMLPQPSTRQSGLVKSNHIDKINLENIHFSYIPEEMVLKGISFQIRRGETVAVVGPTGAGKTSLINLIPRFYDPTTGRILVNDHDLKTLNISQFRSKIALVMQDPFLFSTTIRENIFQGSDNLSDEDVARIIEASQCSALIEKLPQGLDTVLSEGGTSISSGERQLISIARAFARNPQLILFDEATSYIDSQTELQIQQALEKLLVNRTALIVAHRLSTVRNADRIIVVNRGRISEEGSHSDLMNRKGFYYNLNQLQR